MFLNNEELRKQIKAIREEKCLSWKAISKATGIKYGSLQNWLGGSYNFGSEKIRIMCRYIDKITKEDYKHDLTY